MKPFDVVIIGAGPGGSAAAAFLAQAGLRVVLLDKAAFPRDKTCGDGLTPRAIGVLQELGVMEAIRREGWQMEEATVFAPNGSAVTTQMPVRDDLPPIMLAIPRLKLDHLILKRALAVGAGLEERVNVQNVETLPDGLLVTGRRDGKTVRYAGRMGVIAVGAGMGLLKRIGLLEETPRLTLAARTYFENVRDLSGRFEFYFEGIPLPGYGWIFPLSPHTANIGAGIFELRGRRPQAKTAQAVLDQFLQLPKLRHLLATARQVGPVRGFPIRTDFARAATFGPNFMLVGEAAGLVNPLTGEGIDYALESGRIAAQHLQSMFAEGQFSAARLKSYDAHLRRHFHDQVVFCERIRDWYLHRPIINRLVQVAQKRDQFRELFTDIVLGNAAAKEAMKLKTVWQILFT